MKRLILLIPLALTIIMYQNCSSGLDLNSNNSSSNSLSDTLANEDSGDSSDGSSLNKTVYEISYQEGKVPDVNGTYSFGNSDEFVVTKIKNATKDTIVCLERVLIGEEDNNDKCSKIENYTTRLGDLDDWLSLNGAMLQTKSISETGLAQGGIVRRYFLSPDNDGKLVLGENVFVSEIFVFPRD
ncbi:MAG: hypothetical protein VX583_00550 [Bdellovibrionota bacterium]|nr:hypothetical protein [Pseudobdellovibrionaceae bacterium]